MVIANVLPPSVVKVKVKVKVNLITLLAVTAMVLPLDQVFRTVTHRAVQSFSLQYAAQAIIKYTLLPPAMPVPESPAQAIPG